MIDFVKLFFIFWYRQAPLSILSILKGISLSISDAFSLPLLLKTLFAPWKRDYVTGRSLQDKLQAWGMNMTSRVMGMIIRMTTMAIGIVIEVISLTLGVIIFTLWLMAPILIIPLFFYSLFLIGGG